MPGATILDASFRSQLLRQLPADRGVQVHVLRDLSWGGVTLNMSSNRVDYLTPGPKDGEKQ
jgi:hypothetical protein